MFETVVQLKPFSQWRAGMTWDKLIAEMNTGATNPPMAVMSHIPISLVAKIGYQTGPPLIRSEDGRLVGFVFVDITSRARM
jgi:Cu/Ag efflux pump CusA